jgi:hypothetical protein
VRLDFWSSTPDGPMSVSLHGQQALFFIRQANAATVEALPGTGAGIKPLELLSFGGDPVRAVYFNSQ